MNRILNLHVTKANNLKLFNDFAKKINTKNNITTSGTKVLTTTNLIKPKVQEIFKEFCKKNRIHLEEIRLVAKRDKDFLSDVSQIRLIGSQQDKCNNSTKYDAGFIVKEVPRNEKYVSIYSCDIAFKNESFAYNKILPSLQKYTEEPFPVPKCIHASNDLIILEDVSDKGFKHFDKINGFTVDVVKSVLKELANLHSTSMIMRHKNASAFQSMSNVVQEVLYRKDRPDLMATQKKAMQMVIQMCGSEEDKFQPFLDKLDLLADSLDDIQIRLLSRKDGPFPVINHGDVWANNILNNQEDGIKMIDFQMMRYTSAAADLNYFFYVNLEPEFRVKHQDEFLEYYLQEVLKRVEVYDLPMKADLTMANLKQEMELYAFFGFVCGLWVLPVFYRSIGPIHKNGEIFYKFNTLSIKQMIKNMLPDEAERFMKLVFCFAKSWIEDQKKE